MRFPFRQPVSTCLLRPPRASAALHSTSTQNSFGIAFDIDGVILRGKNPIGSSPRALKRLYDDSGALKIPFLFLTNGGGIPESRRALELSDLLGVKILPSQVLLGHSPFRNFLNRFENEFIVATGKGEPAVVMSEYGFKRVVSLDEYASYFDNIDPVAQYKRWTTKHESECARNSEKIVSSSYMLSTKVKAAFVVSDPVDWGRDIQVLCDIFSWIVALGKLPTCDSVQRRWKTCVLRPQWCCLCREHEENQDHILLHCSFTTKIWAKLCSEMGIQWVMPRHAKDLFHWNSEAAFNKKNSEFWHIIVHAIYWSIWLEKNRRIFEDKSEPVDKVWENIKFLVASWATALQKFDHLSISELVRDFKFVWS